LSLHRRPSVALLIGEQPFAGRLLGLYVASTTWQCWPENRQWLKLAREEFGREALLQNTADGVTVSRLSTTTTKWPT